MAAGCTNPGTGFERLYVLTREQAKEVLKSQIVKEAPEAVLSASTGDVSTTGGQNPSSLQLQLVEVSEPMTHVPPVQACASQT